ncbi:MAG: EamA family transporter [Thermoanaerobaculia bacterium]
MSAREKLLAYVAFGVVCTVWGTTYLAIRVAIETLPTFLFPGLRFTIAGVILLAICLARGEKLPPRMSDWANLALIGVLMVGAGNVAVVWAEHWVTSGFAALLVATSPFWMATLEALRPTGERLTRRKTTGLLLGFAGVLILVAPSILPSSFRPMFLLGVIVLQLGTIGWDIGSIRSKYHAISAPALVSAAVQMISGGVVVSLIGLALGEAPQFHFSGRTLAAFLYLVVFGSILAYAAYVYALSKLPTSTVLLHAYVNPAVAVVVGWLILDEPLGWNAILAMLVIFSGVALVQRSARQRRLEIIEPAASLEKV